MAKLRRVGSFVLTMWVAFSGQAFCADLTSLLDGARAGEDEAAVLYVMQGDEEYVAVSGKRHPETGDAQADDRFAIASVGKIFTAVAVLQLAEAGKLGIDDPVANWIDPDLARSLPLSGVTLRHLLNMTSGIEDYYTDDYLDEVLEEPAAQTPENALNYVAGPHLFSPGTAFEYSNTNYVLLQLVLQQASGQPMARYFEQNIFAPVGMQKTYVFGTQAHPDDFVAGFEDLGSGPEDMSFYYLGQGFGDGGIISTARDVAKFYYAVFEDQSLLSADSLDMMLSDPMGEGYGMGVEIVMQPDLGLVYGHSGADLGFSSDVRLAVSSGTIAVALFAHGQADGAVTDDALELVTR